MHADPKIKYASMRSCCISAGGRDRIKPPGTGSCRRVASGQEGNQGGSSLVKIGQVIYCELRMNDRPSEDDTRRLTGALRDLIRPGVYAAALENSPLIELPAVTKRTGAEAPATTRARAFIEVLNTVISSRLSRTDRDAASILFAVGDWSGVPVRERHHAVAKLRNKHWTWERNYRKEPLSRDLLAVLRAIAREGDAQEQPANVPEERSPTGRVGDEARYHMRRLGRRRTAYPLDMSLDQLRAAGLIVPIRLGEYHVSHGSGRSMDRQTGLDQVISLVAKGQSALLLGEPGSGKTLAIYQLAAACEAAGLTPFPVRAAEIPAILARDGWRGVRAARAVILLDSLDEAIGLIARDTDRFSGQLRELLSAGPYVVSSRVREFEELVSGGFPDPGFDVVYMIEPWNVESDFRDYLSRLTRAGLLNEPALYETVVGSQDLARLVSRPLYARMLTFVGEEAGRALRDHIALYGEYLSRLSRVTDYALEGQGLHAGGSLALWQSAAWAIHAAGGASGEPVSLAEVEQRLSGRLPHTAVRRVLDQIVDRGSAHGRETGEFIHYSFYEYLVAREVHDRIMRDPDPAGIASLLKDDLPREVRHYLIGQLRVSAGPGLRESLFRSYESVRNVLDVPEHDRLSVCNLLIYLISRVVDSCTAWLRGQLAGEQVIFLRHAMLWAMCHAGSGWALREFFDALEDPGMRSECRGYTLYYYGDLPREAGPPYRDDSPASISCRYSYRRIMAMFTDEGFTEAVAPERRFIDLYTFLDILRTRGIRVPESDRLVILGLIEGLRAARLPASLLTRLTQMASPA